jgi:DNA invertase Pin-like site-specific DNA recombinase
MRPIASAPRAIAARSAGGRANRASAKGTSTKRAPNAAVRDAKPDLSRESRSRKRHDRSRSAGAAHVERNAPARGSGAGARLAKSYARKSDENELGCDAQHESNAAKAKLDGFLIPDSPEFRLSDDHTSGASDNRSAFKRLLTEAKAGAIFSRVYVLNSDRFGRWDDTRLHSFYEVEFERAGSPIYYTEGHIRPENFATAEIGDVARYAFGHTSSALVASEERKKICSRTKRGRRVALRNGFWPGASLPPYATERMIVDAETRRVLGPAPIKGNFKEKGTRFVLRWTKKREFRIVQEVFNRVEAGEAFATIATDLNLRGIPSPGSR